MWLERLVRVYLLSQELLGDNQHIVIDYVRQSCICVVLGNHIFPIRFGFEIIYQRRGNGQIPAVAAQEGMGEWW